jgi:hypothetical protein
LEGAVTCKESSTDVDENKVILDVYPMMKGEKKKTKKTTPLATKFTEKEFQYCKRSNHQEEKCFWNPNNLENRLKEKQEVAVNEVTAQQPRQGNYKHDKP